MAKTIFTAQHKAFIHALRQIRRAQGITQVQLSSRLGKAQSYISNIERGERRLDVIEFVALAVALGLEPTELFGNIVAKMVRTAGVG